MPRGRLTEGGQSPICFYTEQFERVPWQATIRRQARSAQSEIPLVWNVLRPLVEAPGACLRFDRLFPDAGGELLLRLEGAGLACWNWPVAGEAALEPVLQALGNVIRRTESNVRRHTEIDAILHLPVERLIAFVEAKLTAPFGVCQAVHGDPDGCRMYRRLLDPAQNGCSYWGLGEGGLAFARRFPRRLVDEYLFFERPNRDAPAGAECDRHYQLMRNWLLGQETARRLGSGYQFWLLVIGDDRRLDRAACEDFASKIRPGAGAFGLTTWQAIRDRLGAGHPVGDYLRRQPVVTPPKSAGQDAQPAQDRRGRGRRRT